MITSKEQKIVDAVSMAASFDSDQISVIRFNGYFLQYKFTGSPAGTIGVYASADEMGVSAADSSWDLIDGTSYTISASGTLSQNINAANYGKFKIVFTRTSGSGNLTVKMCAKTQG